MSIVLLDQISDEVKEIKSSLVYDKSRLNDLVISEDFKITSGSKPLVLTGTAIGSLATLLDIPKGFFIRLLKKDLTAWKLLTDRLKEVNDKEIIICSENKNNTAINVFNGESDYLPIDKSFDALYKLGLLMKDGYDMKGARVNYNHISAEFTSNNSATILTTTDVFKTGFSILLDHTLVKPSQVSYLIERLICTNMTYVTQKGYYTYVKNPSKDSVIEETIGKFLDSTKNRMQTDLFGRISNMRNIDLSLAEAETIHAALHKAGQSKEVIEVNGVRESVNVIPNLDKEIPIESYYKRYGVDIVTGRGLTDHIKRSHKWKASATVPLRAYDAYNYVTFEASNNKSLSDTDALELKILGGNLITKKYDLVDLAPKVSWN